MVVHQTHKDFVEDLLTTIALLTVYFKPLDVDHHEGNQQVREEDLEVWIVLEVDQVKSHQQNPDLTQKGFNKNS